MLKDFRVVKEVFVNALGLHKPPVLVDKGLEFELFVTLSFGLFCVLVVDDKGLRAGLYKEKLLTVVFYVFEGDGCLDERDIDMVL